MTKNQFMALVYLILYSIIYPISFETTFNLLVSLALLGVSVRKIFNAIEEFEKKSEINFPEAKKACRKKEKSMQHFFKEKK